MKFLSPFFIIFFISFFNKPFFIYIKMPKTLLAKHYQENKKRLEKKVAKYITIFLKKKEKSSNMAINVTKISLMMKNKNLL